MARTALGFWYWPLSLLFMADLLLRPVLVNDALINLARIPYSNATKMEVTVWPSTASDCTSCGYLNDITFSLQVNWTIGTPLPHATLVLFASFDMVSWFVPSDPALIDAPTGAHNFSDGCYGLPGSLYLVPCVYNGALGPLLQGSGPFAIGGFYLYCDFFENRCGTTCGAFQSVPDCSNSSISTFGYKTRDYPEASYPYKSFTWFFVIFCILTLNEYIGQAINALCIIFFWVQPASTDLGAKALHTVERADAQRRLTVNVVTCTGGVQVNRLIRLVLNIYLSLIDSPEVTGGVHVDLGALVQECYDAGGGGGGGGGGRRDSSTAQLQAGAPRLTSACVATYYIRLERAKFSDDEMRDLLLVAATVREVVRINQQRLAFLSDFVHNSFDDAYFAPDRLLDAATLRRIHTEAAEGAVPITVVAANQEFSWMVGGDLQVSQRQGAGPEVEADLARSTSTFVYNVVGADDDDDDDRNADCMSDITDASEPVAAAAAASSSAGAGGLVLPPDLAAHISLRVDSVPRESGAASATWTPHGGSPAFSRSKLSTTAKPLAGPPALAMRVYILGRDEIPAVGTGGTAAGGREALLGRAPEVEKGKVHGLNAVVRRIHAAEAAAAVAAAATATVTLPATSPRSRSTLAIIDDRHFPTKLFWSAGLPLLRQYNYRFVQFAQQFVAVLIDRDTSPDDVQQHGLTSSTTFQTDTLDIANGMYYFFANAVRNLLHSVASAGTNAMWVLEPFHDDGAPFQYSVDTYIEDTETSHDVFFRGEKTFYIGDADIHYVRGIAKPPSQYATSLQRWSFGALQLFVKHAWRGSGSGHVIGSVILIRLMIIGLFLYLILFVDNAQLYIVIVAAGLLVSAYLLHTRHRLAGLLAYLIVFNDSTYWLTGILSPVVWIIFVPVWSFLEGEQLLQVNIQIYIGLLLVSQVVQWAMLLFVKSQTHLKEAHIHNSRMSYYLGYNVFLYNLLYALWRKLWDHGRVINKPHDATWSQKDDLFFAFVRVLLLLEFGIQVAAFVVSMVRLLDGTTEMNVYSPYFIFAISFFTHIMFMVKPVALIVFNKDITFSARHVILVTTVIYIVLYFDTVTEWTNLCYILPSYACSNESSESAA